LRPLCARWNIAIGKVNVIKDIILLFSVTCSGMLQPYTSISKIFLDLKYGGLYNIAYIITSCFYNILRVH